MTDYTTYEYMPYSKEVWDQSYMNYLSECHEWHFPDNVIYAVDFYCEESWFKIINGKILEHNINAPAEYLCVRGKIKHENWWYEGVEYNKEDFFKIMAFLEKRKRKLARWVYEQWYTHFMRNPFTKKGKYYIQKDYDRMMASLTKRYK